MNLLKCNTLRIYRQRFIMRTSTNSKSLRQDSTYTVSLKKFSNLLISSMTKRRSIFDWSPRKKARKTKQTDTDGKLKNSIKCSQISGGGQGGSLQFHQMKYVLNVIINRSNRLLQYREDILSIWSQEKMVSRKR